MFNDFTALLFVFIVGLLVFEEKEIVGTYRSSSFFPTEESTPVCILSLQWTTKVVETLLAEKMTLFDI